MPVDERQCAGVLIVEDDVDILQALVQVLEDEGHAVRVAENGWAALVALRAPDAHPPCVILLDLMMPVMDGWAFRAAQVADPALAPIPVIVLTADGATLERGSLIDGTRALKKPIDLETLIDALAPYLHRANT